MSLRRPKADLLPQMAVVSGRRRVCVLGAVFGVAFLSIGLRLIDMVDWQETGKNPPGFTTSVRAAGPEDDLPRAEIVDRHGSLLATNRVIRTAVVNPSSISDKAAAARLLAGAVDGGGEKAILARLERGGGFAEVKREVSPREQEALLRSGVPGLAFRPGLRRFYPKLELASHLVGFVDKDSHGLVGIERSQDDRLTASAEQGPLALSLDLRVQQTLREELFSAFIRFKAQGASGMVLDRRTGEVLGMVSLPDFDPNNPPNSNPATQTDDDRARLLNRVTGGVYELGSLFKVFTTALALRSGAVHLNDQFDATNPLTINRFTIHDDHAQRRWLSVPECFIYSSNICTAKMAFKAGGSGVMEGFLREVGFYAKPDIELPQTELRRPLTPTRWPDVTTATVSFGHGISVSPLHYVTAVSGLLGDGTWAKPTLLKRAPEAIPIEPAPVSAAVAQDLRWLMWLTVAKGTGERAGLPSYLVGGKTGTADKPSEGGRGYREGAVLASFVGVFPIENPRYVVLALLDEPHGDAGTQGYHYGAWTAAPVVGAVIDRIGPLLGIEPSLPSALTDLQARLLDNHLEGREERLAALVAAR